MYHSLSPIGRRYIDRTDGAILVIVVPWGYGSPLILQNQRPPFRAGSVLRTHTFWVLNYGTESFVSPWIRNWIALNPPSPSPSTLVVHCAMIFSLQCLVLGGNGKAYSHNSVPLDGQTEWDNLIMCWQNQ